MVRIFPLFLFASFAVGQELPTESWMGHLYGERPDTRLADLVIPGTHDAATYAITARSAIAPGEPRAYHLVRPVVARWSLTQRRTTADQLRDGIRYLDLRVAAQDGELVIVHGLVSLPLAEVLAEVAAFCAAQPREIVLLDFQKMPGKEHREAFAALLHEHLGPRLVPDSFTPTSSLGALWDADRNALCLLRDGTLADSDAAFWKRSRRLAHTWADATALGKLRRRLDEDLAAREGERFLCSFLTFTPDLDTILASGVASGEGLAELSAPLFDKPGQWIPAWLDAGLPVNIVANDFYEDTDLVAACLAANRRRIAEAEGR